jgi:hypothetical protein
MNPEHLAILRKGIKTWNAWRADNPSILPDLRGSDLIGANLSDADLRGTNLSRANLCESDLSEADLSIADLRESDLSGVNLIRADLRKITLCNTNIDGARFCPSDVGGHPDACISAMLTPAFWEAHKDEILSYRDADVPGGGE